MIPSEQIEQIKESVDIADIIGSFIKLTRRGKNYLALCPFHSEKTPSFTVSPDKQIYYCFGCGTGGNVINFIMNHEKMGFVEAVLYLAEQAGIAVTETSTSGGAVREQNDRIYNANRVASEYFRKSLKSPGDNIAVNYLKGRKIPASAVKEFGIGYAPDKTNGLLQYASKKDVDPEALLSAGLVTKTNYGFRDFFRGRLIFPIKNLSGRVVAFGGRTLKENEPSKYINTPETSIYRKGNQLFGLNLSKDYIRETKQAIVVEGYTDLISLYSSGIKNVVCSSGTAFTVSQASLISRFAEEVITLFDSDTAGIKAAGRSVGELLSKGLDTLICVLPDNEDPDSLIKSKGIKHLRKYIGNALRYPEFKKMTIGKNFKDLPVGKQEELIMEFSEIIFRIDDPLKQRLFTQHLEEVFDFPISAYTKKHQKKTDETEKESVVTRNRTMLEREFLLLLSENQVCLPEIADIINPECFTDDGCRMVYVRMLDEYSKNNSLEIKKWVETDTPSQVIETLVGMDNFKGRLISSRDVFNDYVNRFRADYNKSLLRNLKAEIIAAENEGNKEKAGELQKRYLRILTGASNR